MHLTTYPEFKRKLDCVYDTQTLKEFTKKAVIESTSGKRKPVSSLNPETIELLYDFIVVNKERYLLNFYKKSLAVTQLIRFRGEKPIPLKNISNHKRNECKSVIRNIHMLGILRDTESGLPNLRTYWTVVHNLFRKWVIDYKLVTPSALQHMARGHAASIISAFYVRASILNPHLIYHFARAIVKRPDSVVFTPTLGWSSYLYGFLEDERVSKYIGVDVIPSVCKKTAEFAREYWTTKEVIIHCCPSEDLMSLGLVRPGDKDSVDVIFFSPPYYDLEVYKGGEQSTSRYRTYEQWLEGYWSNTMKVCRHLMKPDGVMCYVLSGYAKYDLDGDMIRVSMENGFNLFKKVRIGNANVNVTKHRETGETAYFWRRSN
jgi:hypothetical protein